MADDINKTILVGRLTRDAELLYTNSGYALCKFSLAVNRRKKQGDQWVDEANFFDVNLWGRIAESLHSYLTKGAQVAIEGHLRQERWEQDGMKRSKVSIEAAKVQLLGGRQNNDQSQGGSYQSRSTPDGSSPIQSQKNRQQEFESYTPPAGPGEYEDDIPF